METQDIQKRLTDLERLENEINDAIKERFDAQGKLEKIIKEAGLLAKVAAPGMSDLMTVARDVTRIRDQEREHEQKLTKALSIIWAAKSGLKSELEKVKRQFEEDEKKQEKR